jgi:hypothetical protein
VSKLVQAPWRLRVLDWLKSWTPMVIDWTKSWAPTVIDWPKSWTPPLLAFKLLPRPRRLVAGALVLVKDRTAATNTQQRGL